MSSDPCSELQSRGFDNYASISQSACGHWDFPKVRIWLLECPTHPGQRAGWVATDPKAEGSGGSRWGCLKWRPTSWKCSITFPLSLSPSSFLVFFFFNSLFPSSPSSFFFFLTFIYLAVPGDQSWVFIGRADSEAETPILWPPHAKSWLTGKDPDAGRDWGQEEKGTTEDEMVGWHHWFNGHGFG